MKNINTKGNQSLVKPDQISVNDCQKITRETEISIVLSDLRETIAMLGEIAATIENRFISILSPLPPLDDINNDDRKKLNTSLAQQIDIYNIDITHAINRFRNILAHCELP